VKNQPSDCRIIFDRCVCFWPLYRLSVFTVRLGSEWVSYTTLSSNTVMLQLPESFGKCYRWRHKWSWEENTG